MESLYSGHLGKNQNVLIRGVASIQGVEFYYCQYTSSPSVLKYRAVLVVPLYTKVSLFQGVEIERLHTEVSSFQGVGIARFHCIQRCPHFRGLE